MNVSIINLNDCMSEQIHILESKCFSDPYSIKTLKNDFSNCNNICFAAVVDGVIVGYCICSTVLDEAELQRIAVDDNFRGRGIASLMMDYLNEQCNVHKINAVYLEVREANVSARKLYEKYKFKQTGMRKAYYSDNGENAILYTLYLDRR